MATVFKIPTKSDSYARSKNLPVVLFNVVETEWENCYHPVNKEIIQTKAIVSSCLESVLEWHSGTTKNSGKWFGNHSFGSYSSGFGLDVLPRIRMNFFVWNRDSTLMFFPSWYDALDYPIWWYDSRWYWRWYRWWNNGYRWSWKISPLMSEVKCYVCKEGVGE